MIQDSAFRMTYYPNSWLNLNSPSMSFQKNPRQGRLETAFTRTGGISASGHGLIGKFDFIIIDILDGAKPGHKNPFRVSVDNPVFMWGNGCTTVGDTFAIDIPLRSEPSKETRNSTDRDFYVYPSPATDRISVHLNGDDLIESLSVFDALGKEVYASGSVQLEHADLDVSNLPEGFYVVSAKTASGNFVKKIQILR